MKVFTATFIVAIVMMTAFWLSYDDLKGWQTLVGALLALAAAVATVLAILQQVGAQVAGVDKQLTAQRDLDHEQRRRRLLSHRALFPEDLGRVASYTRESALLTRRAIEAVRNNARPHPFVCPSVRDRVWDDLRFLIENSDEEIAVALANLVSCYQVQHSRFTSEIKNFNERAATEANLEFTFEKTVELSLMISRMWEFARRESDEIPQETYSLEELHNACPASGPMGLIEAFA